MPIDGFDQLVASLKGVAVRADAAALRSVTRSQALFEGKLKAAYTDSHRRGTPTPAAPGRPPAVVTGTLRRSVTSDRPQTIGPGSYSGQTYPSTVYARIQELGGVTGRGHRTVLPPRPSVGPTLESIKPQLVAINNEEFSRALGV